MSARIAACAAAALACAVGAQSAHAECPPSDEARISVEVSAGPVETVFDTSLEELERMARAAGREAHLPLRAVYSSDILFTADIDTQVQETTPRKSCAIAKSIRIRIAIGKRTIHAARELRDKTCLRTAATDHAATHARLQEVRLFAARETIVANLKAILREPSPIADSAAEAERSFARLISAQIDEDLARIDADKTEAGRTIDSSEVLAQLKAACQSEQADPADDRTWKFPLSRMPSR